MELNLKQLMHYQLTPVPYCIGTADSFVVKNPKADGMQHLIKDVDDADATYDDATLYIFDGNATCGNQCLEIFIQIS